MPDTYNFLMDEREAYDIGMAGFLSSGFRPMSVIIGTGDGVTRTFNYSIPVKGLLPKNPEFSFRIRPNYVFLHVGEQYVTDNGAGALVGDIGTDAPDVVNRVDYATGAVGVTFKSPVPSGCGVSLEWEMVAPVIYSAPQRAFARVKDIYGITENMEPPLPVISFYCMGEDANAELAFVNPRMMVSRVSADHKKIRVSKYPKHIIRTYQADIWAYTQSAMHHLVGDLTNRFADNIAYITVGLGVWGDKFFSIKSAGWTDNSQLEYGEDLRVLRMTSTFTLNAVSLPPTSIGRAVTRIEVPIYMRDREAVRGQEDSIIIDA